MIALPVVGNGVTILLYHEVRNTRWSPSKLVKAEVEMAVDPFRVISAALGKSKSRLRLRRLSSVDYDEEADVLYARFSRARIVDSKALDQDGMVTASLASNGRTIGLILMHASSFS